MLNYINIKYKPSKEDVIVEYYAESADLTPYETAERIVEETSLGEWTDVFNKKIAKKLKPTVFEIKDNYIKIAYPYKLFEKSSITQILSSLTGDIFGINEIKTLKLEDISFPLKIVEKFPGPKHGIKNIRKILAIKDKPIVSSSITPLILNPKEYAEKAKHIWLGGSDIIIDDEKLTNQTFNRFKDRIIQTMDARNKVEDRLQQPKMYIPNITAETEEMIARLKFVKELGGRAVAINTLITGFSALQTLRKADSKIIIYSNNTMNSLLTRNPQYGISSLIFVKLARLAGADIINIGTTTGKAGSSPVDTIQARIEIEEKISQPNKKSHRLEQKWNNLLPSLALCSNITPSLIPDITRLMSNNIIVDATEAINKHPGNLMKGAQAIQQAIEATRRKIPLKKFAITHSELRDVLK
jgi:ribulose-bisphosphate carboxylase large chain